AITAIRPDIGTLADSGDPHTGAPDDLPRSAGQRLRLGRDEDLAPLGQSFEDRKFLLQYAVQVAEEFEVLLADRGYDGQIRPDDPRQGAHLAGTVGSDLDHRDLGLRREAQECQRDADLIVQVPPGRFGAIPRAQRGADQLLRRGLAVAAYDGDEARGEPLSPILRQAREGGERIVHRIER